MNIDFHYYGTFVAARLAGYNKDEAQIIAHSAQYVDDSGEDMIADITEFTPVPTVYTNSMLNQFLNNVLNWNEDYSNQSARVWQCFHFLPGNYGDNPPLRYSGKTSDKGELDKWKYDAESEELFKMVCYPNSEIVGTIVQDIIDNHINKDYTLHLAGLRMHTLSDTWAHMYYAGIPAWFIADAGQDVYLLDGKGERTDTVKWGIPKLSNIAEGCGQNAYYANKESSSPNMPHYNSIVYLGHTRMGHLPDYPWIHYEYAPQWSQGTIKKNNQDDFLKALRQMIYALSCIKNRQKFQLNEYADMDASTTSAIQKILCTDKSHGETRDQCTEWKEYIANVHGGIDDYDKNRWLNEYRSKRNFHYNHFNRAAVLHLDLVRDTLKTNKIFIDETPKERIVRAKFFHIQSNKFIGSAKYERSVTNPGEKYSYPVMSTGGITLSIIKPNGSALKSGDIVKIKTDEALEKVTSNSPMINDGYLGAWSTEKALYYYTKDYSVPKQKWEIINPSAPRGTEIQETDTVEIRNCYFEDQYMIPYKPSLYNTYYLTTKKHNDGVFWQLKFQK